MTPDSPSPRAASTLARCVSRVGPRVDALFSGARGWPPRRSTRASSYCRAAPRGRVRAPARGRRLRVVVACALAPRRYVAGDPFSIVDVRAFVERFLMQVEVYGKDGEETGVAVRPCRRGTRDTSPRFAGIAALLLAAGGARSSCESRRACARSRRPAASFFGVTRRSAPIDRNLLVPIRASRSWSGLPSREPRRCGPAPRRVGRRVARRVARRAGARDGAAPRPGGPPARKAARFDAEIRRKTTHEMLNERLAAFARGSRRVAPTTKPDAPARSYRDLAAQVRPRPSRERATRSSASRTRSRPRTSAIERECALVATIRNPLFDSGDAAPKRLEPFATAAPYHDPTY